MILRNHGLLVCGPTAARAYDELYTLERACSAQIAAMTGGAELILPPKEVCERAAAQFRGPELLDQCDFAWGSEPAADEGQGTDWRA